MKVISNVMILAALGIAASAHAEVCSSEHVHYVNQVNGFGIPPQVGTPAGLKRLSLDGKVVAEKNLKITGPNGQMDDWDYTVKLENPEVLYRKDLPQISGSESVTRGRLKVFAGEAGYVVDEEVICYEKSFPVP